MPDYQQGKIYRLVSNKTEDVYYGATTRTLTHRKNHHKSHLNCSSKKLFENDAVVTIILVEAFPCNNKNELKARELFYITNNPCINNNKPFISELNYGIEYQKEYREAHKETISKYYEANKEAILEHQHKYRESNKEARLEQSKKYYEANKEAIIERVKAYSESNKEAISERRKQAYKNKKAK